MLDLEMKPSADLAARIPRIKAAHTGLLMLAIFALSLLYASISKADGVVAGCTEDELIAALNGGGVVSFATNCSITLDTALVIDLTDSDTTIDANNHTVNITGPGDERVFKLQAGTGSLKLIGLTIFGGQHTNGGALFIPQNTVVTLSNCTF